MYIIIRYKLLKDIYFGLKFSFSYFSNIPIKFNNNDDLTKSNILAFMLFFLPSVGFILGLISISIFLLLSNNIYLGAIISSILYMMLYGFIHTEAICDVVDAIYAKHSGKDPYTIIKEPTVGAIGVMYSVSFIILKITTLTFMFINNMFYEILAILIISRVMLGLNIYIKDFKSSFLEVLKKAYNIKFLILSIIIYNIIGYFLLNINFFILFICGIFFSFLITNYIYKKLTFLNGDTLGLNLEINELLLFWVVIYLF